MSETSVNLLAGQSSLWVQPDGPNTEPKYLGCHSIGDITEPLGDLTLLYKPDPSMTGKYMVKNSFSGEQGAITTTIETDMLKTADFLEALSCPVPIFIHKVACGRRDVFSNFDRTFVLRQSRVTQRSLGNVASRQPSDENETTQSFEISAQFLSRIFKLQASRVAIAETEAITGISICGEERCEGPCGQATKVSDHILVSTKFKAASAGSTADVLYSANDGAFAATAADPFAATEDIQGIVCFKTGRDTTRVIVARGTTDPATPVEIAYSDDYGVTWTLVEVGVVDGAYVANSHALFALDRYHIWLGTDGGYIYFSNDGGVTWTAQESGVISATDVIAIHFVDASVGFALYTGGQVAKTVDGGVTWSAVTASGITTGTDIHVVSPYVVWVSGGNGLRFTVDGGLTWTARLSVAIGAIDFLDELAGLAVGSAASGKIYQTINGGYDWLELPAITNAGMQDVIMISNSLAFAVGVASGGTGFIARITPQA